MWNLKYDTNTPIYKTKTDSQMPRGKRLGEGWIRSLGLADANYDTQNG